MTGDEAGGIGRGWNRKSLFVLRKGASLYPESYRELWRDFGVEDFP